MPLNTSKGIYFALFTALISGISIFINKFAVGAIKPPLVFVATKNVGVGLIILAIILSTGKWRKIKHLNTKDFWYLVLIGVIGGAIPFYLFFTGISQIPAVNAAIIHKTLIIWVAILALPLLKEKLSSMQVIAVALLFLGNLMIGGFGGFEFSRGEFFVLLATILWAAENVLAKKVLSRVDPDLVTMSRMGIGSLILVLAAVVTSPQALGSVFSLTPAQIFWLIATAIALLGYVSTWYRALKLAPATTVASVLVVSTLITNILSATFITHTFKLILIPQAGLMFLGISLFVMSANKQAGVKTSA